MKTRVAQLTDGEFVPQYWVPHFLWGGHWEGLQRIAGAIYSWETPSSQLKFCSVPTAEEADSIIEEFLHHRQKKDKLL